MPGQLGPSDAHAPARRTAGEKYVIIMTKGGAKAQVKGVKSMMVRLHFSYPFVFLHFPTLVSKQPRM
jgi:hypothetical protein